MGYNLLDSHSGKFSFVKFGHKISFLINQLVRRSPINLRKQLGVEKTYNAKAMGLFLKVYSDLKNSEQNIIKDSELDDLIQFFYKWLMENYCENYSGICWGYHYDWPRSDGSMFKAGTPNVVVTTFVCRGLIAYYKATGNSSVKSIIKSAAKFVVNDLYSTEQQGGLCYSYTPEQRDMIFNANLLAAEILSFSDILHNEELYSEQIRKVLKFTLDQQNEDGSWYYSLDPNTGKPKKQIDFHQGYMVESIHRICCALELKNQNYRNAINRGLNFYFNNQFFKNGISLWRYPKKWPIDIHNQSQGIITFTILRNYNAKYLDFAKKIAGWTIQNMQGDDGEFYYQKWPLFTNKIPYMRWNQAWMLSALTTLLCQNDIEK